MRAAGALRRSGSIACVTAMTPNTFVSNTARTSSSEATLGRPDFAISCNGLPGLPACETPALFTSTSRRPSSVRIRSAAAAIEAWSVTSSSSARAGAPTLLAAVSPCSRLRDATSTVKPRAARSFAISRPIPLLAPVTRATGLSCIESPSVSEYEGLFRFTIRIMRAQPRPPLEPRKTPIQTRSAVTVDVISEATIQVLLSVGPDQLTTTRVAERAGVSVGTLYQYFPNKHSLLFSVLQQHLNHVADAVERACRQNHGERVSTMVDAVVQAFLDAKMERADISTALYAVATGREETALVKKVGKRMQVALASMLATASDARFDDLPFSSFLVFSAMGGVMRAILEGGAPPKMVRSLRKQLVLLCRGFLMSVGRCAQPGRAGGAG